MTINRFTLCFWFLLPALFWGLSWGIWAQESLGTENSGSALNRLIEISGQLSNLNERLRTELQDSRRSSRELEIMLEISRQELDGLRLELGVLQNSSTELLLAAENSLTELTGLQTALREAESSLMSLELSFAAYREVSERRTNILLRENRLMKWGCAAAGVIAVGFATAFMMAR